MSQPTLSPDGKWMWNGDEWIPAPPKEEIVPEDNIQKELIQQVAESEQVDVHQLQQTAPYFDENRDGVLQESEVRQAAQSIQVQPTAFVQPQVAAQQPVMQQPVIHQTIIQQPQPEKASTVPWIGVGAIIIALFLPFMTLGGFIEVSGMEMIVEISDLISEFDGSDSSDDGFNDGFDDGSNEGSDMELEEFAFVLAIFLFLASPFFFLFSAIVSSLVLLSRKSPKLMGSLHLGYALLFVICGLLSPTFIGISIFDFIGIGFYIGAFASVFLIIGG